MMDNFERANARIQKEIEEREKRNLDTSNRKLERVIESKIRTSFIGAIATFENRFGDLWGHGKPFDSLTEQQKENRRDWADARAEILDKGNNQIRAIHKEMDQYTVKHNVLRTIIRNP